MGIEWGDWANSANWQDGRVPGFEDTAEFPNDARVKLSGNITILSLKVDTGVTMELMGAFDCALEVRNYNLKLTPGVRRARFTQTSLDASKAKALMLTGRIETNEDGKLTVGLPTVGRLSVSAPTGRLTIGEKAVLIAGESKLLTGQGSWLKLEGDVFAGNNLIQYESGEHEGHTGHDYCKGALVFTDDLAANGAITLEGTITFDGNEGGLLAYPNTNFTLYAGGAVITIAGGNFGLSGRVDSFDDPLNGIELNHSSLTSGRSGLLLTGNARAYGLIKMRGNLVFALSSSLTNYDYDGFTIFADGRPVMFCVDGAEIGTGLKESFLIMRGDSQFEISGTLARSTGIKNWQGRLTLSGGNFTLTDDMPASGVVTFEGSLNFKNGGLIVYPKMAFTMYSIDGTVLSIRGDGEDGSYGSYDDPLNGLELGNCKFIVDGDGMTIEGVAQVFGLLRMRGTLRLAPKACLGNYDSDEALLMAEGGDLMIKPAIESLVAEVDPWADLMGEDNRNGLLLKAGETASFNGASKQNANDVENWSGNIVTVGNVKGLRFVPLD